MREEGLIAVYMLSNHRHGTIYIGVTGHLLQRMHQHQSGHTPGFVSRYGLNRLVWYEVHDSIEVAIQRETSLKRYLRAWKIKLIEQQNPGWNDLWTDLVRG